MKINQENAKAWSRLGPRAIFGQAILSEAMENPFIMALTGDLGRSSGLSSF